ncbi:MAG TPA: tetratricopeptide repeat protein, partial [Armatimonadota bacterium]|nr:tetratricopeptide repeat protein [Armatimonadota bacterium]
AAAAAGNLRVAAAAFARALALAEADDRDGLRTADSLTCLGILAFHRGVEQLGNAYYHTIDLHFTGAREWDAVETPVRPHYNAIAYGDPHPIAAHRAQAAFKEAAAAFNRAHGIRVLALKTDDPALLAAAGNLAAAFSLQGKPAPARSLLAAALAAAPAETPLAATLQSNLAAVEANTIRYPRTYAFSRLSAAQQQAAEALLRQALAVRVNIYGSDSPQALMSLLQLGHLFADANPRLAARQLAQALAIAKKRYPPDSHNVLAVADALAATYRNSSELHADEERLFNELDADITAVAGARSARRIPALLRLGWHYGIYGTPAQAREPLLAALQLAEAAGEDSTAVADVLECILRHSTVGEPAARDAWRARAQAIRAKAWGAVSVRMAEHIFDGQRYEPDHKVRADQLARVRAIFERVFAPDTPEMLALTLADDEHGEPLFFQKPEQQQARIDRMAAVYGDTHPALTPLLLRYGKGARRWEYTPQIEANTRRAVAIQEAAVGPDSPEMADALWELQEICYRTGHDAERETVLLRGLAIQERIYGKGDLRRLSPWLDALTETYACLQRLADQEAVLRRILGPQRPEPGDDPVDMSYRTADLAAVLKAQGKFAEAEPYYLRMLANEEKEYGVNHFHLNFPLRALAEFYEAWGKPEKAQPMWERSHALSMQEPNFSNDVMEQLAANYLKLNQVDRAEAAYAVYLDAINQRHPGKPEAGLWRLLDWAEFEVKAGRYSEARAHVRQAAALPRPHDLRLYLDRRIAIGLGDAAFGLKEFPEAETQYRQAVAALRAVAENSTYDLGRLVATEEQLAITLRALNRPDDAAAIAHTAKADRERLEARTAEDEANARARETPLRRRF